MVTRDVGLDNLQVFGHPIHGVFNHRGTGKSYASNLWSDSTSGAGQESFNRGSITTRLQILNTTTNGVTPSAILLGV